MTKIVDARGRLALGSRFAGRTVLVEECDGRIVITLAATIPERELWLFRNAAAKQMVAEGLNQARSGQSAAAPDLAADATLAAQLED